MTSPSSSSREDHLSIWLDLLPRDICERIAASISGPKYLAKLSLAQVTNKQRVAVLASLNYTLHLDASREHASIIRRWAQISSRQIVNLRLCDASRNVLHGGRRLLLSPVLRCAQLEFLPEYLLALAYAPQLCHLEINLRAEGLREDDLQLFCDMLNTVRLRKLVIRCNRCFADCKVMKQLYMAKKEDVCFLNQLTEFSIVCPRTPDLFPFVAAMPNLRILQIEAQQVPEDYLSRIQRLDQVHLVLSRDSTRTAVRIGRAVHSLTSTTALSFEEIAMLRLCPYISKLNITIAQGAEPALANLTHDLEHLTIRWYHLEYDHDFVNHDQAQLPLQEQYESMQFYMPKPGAIKQIVLNFPSLTSLCLLRMRIAMTELRQILAALGNKLDAFEASIVDQDETPQERLALMMEAVGRYNRSVRRFGVSELAVSRRPTPIRSDELGKKLAAAYSFLRSRAPFCDTTKLQTYIEAETMERAVLRSNGQM